MSGKVKGLLGLVLALLLVLAGCKTQPVSNTDTTLNIVATTTMLTDLSRIIGGERVSVSGLMGPGIDPHLYQASAGDVTRMQESDVVIYNGLHLEGKLGEIFEALSGQGHAVICIEEGLDKSRLLARDGGSVYDPHIWFDISLWEDAAGIVTQGLSRADPDHASDYEKNRAHYLKDLAAADTYIRSKAAEIPEDQRVLITAHDAFHYFGKAYGFEVRGLQGISTDAEAGTADVSALAGFIAERRIKALFVESSVPSKTIKALQAAVRAKGFQVSVGGELYSDSLGGENSGAESYVLAVKANIDTIVNALK